MQSHAVRLWILTAAMVGGAWFGCPGVGPASAATPAYRSPQALAISPDGRTIYAVDRTAGCVVVLDAAAGKAVREIPVGVEPCGAALSADGRTLWVACRRGHDLAVVDLAASKVVRRIPVGPWPVAVTPAEKIGRLFTCNRGDSSVSAIDLGSGKELRRIGVVREPGAAALTPDQSRLFVANLLPVAVNDPSPASEISVIDTAKLESIARIKLPAGSTIVPGIAVSPDGKWAYAVHTLGRFKLPISQLERGWVHTFALSILDVNAGRRLATVLLDDLTLGAADPWDVSVARDGRRLAVSHAGTHQVSLVAIDKLHELLQGKVSPAVAAIQDGPRDNIWVRIQKDRSLTALLENDLTALHFADVVRRVPAGGRGPRGTVWSPDGTRLYAANYFDGTVGVIDPQADKLLASIPVGAQPPADAARRGEIYFHDAARCFQHWHSCASCHPDGRVDGLTWDFLRDGIGNGKDVISLVGMMHTSPHNRRATRPTPQECMRTGVTGSHLVMPEPGDVDDLTAYVASLQPEPNPVVDRASEAVKRGKAVFEGKAGCVVCHPGPWFTDNRMHNIGTTTPLEPDGKYDTPSLVECYRTAPYFHDGRAATLKESLTVHNPEDRHGKTKDLTPSELDDLIAYLMSL